MRLYRVMNSISNNNGYVQVISLVVEIKECEQRSQGSCIYFL